MTDDQRRSRGVLEGGAPGLATVHDLFSGRTAAGSPAGRGKKGKQGRGEEAAPVVSLDGTRLNQHDLRDLIAQKEAEWRAGQTADHEAEDEAAPEGSAGPAPTSELAQPAWSTPEWGAPEHEGERKRPGGGRSGGVGRRDRPSPDGRTPNSLTPEDPGATEDPDGITTARRGRAEARRGQG